MTTKYAVVDRYDGGTGETIVSRHRTLVGAIRAQRRLQRRLNRANPNALSKYGVTGAESAGEYWTAVAEVEEASKK